MGYLLAGLGSGAVVASLGLGLVLTWRTSRVVNFAHAAMGMYVAFAYFEFRDNGNVVLPVLGLPDRINVMPSPTLETALVFAIVLAALLGLAVYGLVFRWLRTAPPLARVVASLGVYLYLQEITRLRFPTAGASVVNRLPVLPEDRIVILGVGVTANRLILAGLVIAVTTALVVVSGRTRFGIATRAAAGNEKAAVLAGISPDRIAGLNWMLSSILGGFAVILIEPIAGLDPTSTSLLVVPALAAALLGGLSSFVITAAAGLGIGVVQSLVLGYAVRPSTTWIPEWVPTTGLQQAIPVLVVIGVLAFRGDPLPTRGSVREDRLPASPEPRRVALWSVVLGGAAVLGFFTLDASWRQALIVTLIAAIMSLSVVVVTGYVGQISLAQLAFAGVSGFGAIALADHGWPFPLVIGAGVVLATIVGVLVGLPATRVRGMALAIATMAAAVAIEALVLGSSALSGGVAGRSAPRPSLFGLDVGISAKGADNFRPEFGLVALALLIVAAAAVSNLRRNRTGLRWLAVRANERAAAAAGIDVARVKLGAFALSSALAGLAGVLLAFATPTLSISSFMVIGALVSVAMTYLAGISSVSGAILAGVMAKAGLMTTATAKLGDGGSDKYVFIISGLSLVVVAVLAPEGITGVVRNRITALTARRPGSRGSAS
ncbi:MAG: ABC transporter permease [Actinobacteria bacterium]|nr:ABC transporter permease [Actinomycetota bacterium]